MINFTPQFFESLTLSKRDTRLLDKIEGLHARVDSIDTLLAKIDQSVATFGVAPQKLFDRLDGALARVDRAIDRIESRASEALDAAIAEIRGASEAKRDLAADKAEELTSDAILDREGFREVKVAVRQLDRLEEKGLERLDKLIQRIEEKGADKLVDIFDALVSKLGAKVDGIDQVLNGHFDARLDGLREDLAARQEKIADILNPPAEPEPEPAPEPEPEPTPEPAPEPAPEPEPEPEPAPEPEPVYNATDFQGEGETVVVIDTGWNRQFIGSDEEIAFEYDFYGADDPSALVPDSNDHGSWVDQVVRGVASMSNVIHMKVFADTGGSANFFDIGQALNWVVENVTNFDITAVNLSLGAGNVQDYVDTHYYQSEYQSLADQGVLTVVAAGNSGEYGMNYLAADPNAIAVSASTSNDTRAGFTQHHEELTDIFAFGSRVAIEDERGGTNTVSGTSFSAPYVAGVAARVQEAADEILDRHLTQDEFVLVMQNSGKDLAGYGGDADGYKVADADLAVEYFIDNYSDFV